VRSYHWVTPRVTGPTVRLSVATWYTVVTTRPGTGKLRSGKPGGTCMANRPANAGSGRGVAPAGNAAPPLDGVAPPPFDAAPPQFDGPPPFDAAPPAPESTHPGPTRRPHPGPTRRPRPGPTRRPRPGPRPATGPPAPGNPARP